MQDFPNGDTVPVPDALRGQTVFIFKTPNEDYKVMRCRNLAVVTADCRANQEGVARVAALAGGWPAGERVELPTLAIVRKLALLVAPRVPSFRAELAKIEAGLSPGACAAAMLSSLMKVSHFGSILRPSNNQSASRKLLRQVIAGVETQIVALLDMDMNGGAATIDPAAKAASDRESQSISRYTVGDEDKAIAGLNMNGSLSESVTPKVYQIIMKLIGSDASAAGQTFINGLEQVLADGKNMRATGQVGAQCYHSSEKQKLESAQDLHLQSLGDGYQPYRLRVPASS